MRPFVASERGQRLTGVILALEAELKALPSGAVPEEAAITVTCVYVRLAAGAFQLRGSSLTCLASFSRDPSLVAFSAAQAPQYIPQGASYRYSIDFLSPFSLLIHPLLRLGRFAVVPGDRVI